VDSHSPIKLAAIARPRLADDDDRNDTGHHLPLRQVIGADPALVAVRGFQIGMLARKPATSTSTVGELRTPPLRKIS
jgi:hypothetical protein